MILIALEFSSDRRSVALARGGLVLAEAVQQTESRATDALGLIEKVLAEAKVAREEVEAIAVGLGPGSYTGVRAAIAVAQGWQLACGVKLLGVSSAAALAAQAQAEQVFGRVNVVIDAQRGEFYLSAWEISADRRTELLPLQMVSAERIAVLRTAEVCVGPGEVRRLCPTAEALARLVSGRTDFTPGERLEPIYLREASFVRAGPVRNV